MKIIKPDPENFNIVEHELFGEKMYLVYPNHIGSTWTKDNLIFRSSLWNSEWEPVSLGFKKFFNWGEKPNICEDATTLAGAKAISKIDGSLLISSRYKGNLILRTRGTVDARRMENGFELDLLLEKYPAAFRNEFIDSEKYTLLYEWVSPLNQIILKYPQPDIYFVGAVSHEDYSYVSQDKLNEWGKVFNVQRPKVYTFENITEMVASISALKDEEGICLYFNDDQDIKKIKSLDYLKKHAFKSNCTYKNLLSLWIEKGKPEISAFQEQITNDFDFECWQMSVENMQDILKHYGLVMSQIKLAADLADSVKGAPRKDAALKILEAFKGTPYSGVAFKYLDGKEISNDDLKKLIMMIAEKENILNRKPFKQAFSVEEEG
jgi:hypothetical protein